MATEQHGARPNRPATPAELAEFTARTYVSELPLVRRPPAELPLDLELADDPFANPDETRAHIARIRAAGLLPPRQ